VVYFHMQYQESRLTASYGFDINFLHDEMCVQKYCGLC
jgi:hypothetical protein